MIIAFCTTATIGCLLVVSARPCRTATGPADDEELVVRNVWGKPDSCKECGGETIQDGFQALHIICEIYFDKYLLYHCLPCVFLSC